MGFLFQMNGKLVLQIIEASLAGRTEQVRLLSNVLNNELKDSDIELSKELTKITSATVFRKSADRVNPRINHISDSQSNDLFLFSAQPPMRFKPILENLVEQVLDQVVEEHKNRDKLIKHQLEPAKTLIFIGPPGVGKTISAQWLAQEMKLPLLTLDLASVMNSQLGKTGNNLKSVISRAASQPCVFLIDEFDAIAKRRDDDTDVGELKRLVTVLLQTIDSWPSTSVLIAATNHAELLDPALWRRFDERVVFNYPSDEKIRLFLEQLTQEKNVINLFPLFRGMSYSDIKTLVNRARKSSIISHRNILDFLITELYSSQKMELFSIEQRKSLAKDLVLAGFSQRKASEISNLSRQTVKKTLVS